MAYLHHKTLLQKTSKPYTNTYLPTQPNMHTKNNDNVACYTCRKNVCDWQKNDDSYEMHVKVSLNCEWLKKHHESLMLIKKFAYRRCFVKFLNNIKLYEHIRTKHAKKFKKIFDNEKSSITFVNDKKLFFTTITLIISSISFVSIVLTSRTSIKSLYVSMISTFATSKTSIFWFEIILRSKSNTFSRISIAFFKSRIF